MTTTPPTTPAAPDETGPAPAAEQVPPDTVAEPAPPVPNPEQAAGAGAATTALPQLVTIVGSLVAPTTLLTSLLFFFGWSHAFWYFDYFGVNSTMLGLTTQDYLMRSLDGLFVPLTVVALLALVVLWGRAALLPKLRERHRSLLPVAAFAGVGLCLVGLSTVLGRPLFDTSLAVAPLSLAAGVLLLVFAVHLHRSGQPRRTPRVRASAVAEWAAVFLLVGLSLFWAASDYSSAVGQSRARQFVTELPTAPSAVLYSSQSLSLDATGVREVRCADPEATYRFRYDGVVLMMQSGDQFLLLPRAWSRADGVAVVLPRTDAVRLEFAPPSADPPMRAAC